MKKIIIFFSFAALLMGGCRGKGAGAGSVATINLDEAAVKSEIADLIDKVEIIPLDSAVSMTFPKKAVVCQGQIILLAGGQVMVFDSAGKFIRNIGRQGNGPGEYMSIEDMCVSVSGDDILCLDGLGRVFRYSVSDGSFIGMTPLSLPGLSPSAILPLRDDGFAVFVPNPNDAEATDFSKDFYCLKEFDRKGRQTGESLKRTEFNMLMSFRSPSTQSVGGDYILSYLTGSGECVVDEGGEVFPFLNLSFGKRGYPAAELASSADPFALIGDVFESDRFKCPLSVCMTAEAFYCTAYGKDSSCWNFVFDKTFTHGFSWQSVGESAPPMYALLSDGEFFYFSFAETLDSAPQDPLSQALVSKFGLSMEEDDNPKIIKVKFKI